LAVVDIQLAGTFDGIDFIRCARTQQPQLRALFISGFQNRVTDDPDSDDFVSKPFRPSELLSCV
jgi:two-component SAPR family response regulator